MPTPIEKIIENEIVELNHSASSSNKGYMSTLVEILKKNTSIKRFLFDYCDMEDEALEILHKSLLTRKNIEYIDLASNDLSDNSEDYIAALISHNTNSDMIIRISGNRFSDDCNKRLEKLATQHKIKLVTFFPRRDITIDNKTGTLNLSNTAFDVMLGELISAQIELNVTINRFLLNNSQLFDDDLSTLHKVLLRRKTITFINFSNNLLSDKSIPFLIQLINNNEGLTLNISGNKFSNQGIRTLQKEILISSKNVTLITTNDGPKPKRPFFNESHTNGSHSDSDLSKNKGHKFAIKGTGEG